MNRNFLHIFGVLLFSSAALASNSFYADVDLAQERNSYQDPDEMSKTFLLNTGTGTFVTINATLLLFSAGILLWGIAGAVALYYLLTAPAGGSSSGYTGRSGYQGRSEQYWDEKSGSFNPYDGVNWEQFTILDFIAIAEEAYRKFNPADLECQKRLICEIHQNTSKFGVAAQRMVDMFSYLQYVEVLSLPEEFKALVEEYLDAADRGRNLQKDCGDVFSACEFSVKKLTDKFSHNEI